MTRKLELLHIPTELLFEIVQYLDPRDHSALRQTCWKTRTVVAKYAFRNVTFDFEKGELVQRQLQWLGIDTGISHEAVKEHIRVLHILQPRLYSGIPYDKQYPEVSTGGLPLTIFRRVEKLKIHDTEALGDNTYSCLSQLFEYLESLPRLFSADLFLRDANIGISLRLPHLRKLSIKSRTMFHNSLVDVITGAPSITNLALLSARHPNPDGSSVTFASLFSRLDPSCPLQLDSLNLDGWELDDTAVQNILPHLKTLQDLQIREHVSGASLLWPAITSARIKLSKLTAPKQASRELLQYLSSFSGLQDLSMSTPKNFLYECSDVCHIARIIRTHSSSLKNLDVLMRWSFRREDRDDAKEALEQCKALSELAVAVSHYFPDDIFSDG